MTTTSTPNFEAQASCLWALGKRHPNGATLEEINELVRNFTAEDRLHVARIAAKLLEEHLARRSET